ncbi:MAG: preprotein translocase subunit SecE [Rhizomicrobium sp.]
MVDATKKTADSAGKGMPVPAPVRRTGVVQFFRETWREGIEKVTWPTWKETWLTTVMVFIMVVLMMLFFFFVDYLMTIGEGWIIGAGGK